MERTNVMNQERMMFDIAAHKYQRRLRTIEQMRRLATEEFQGYFSKLVALKGSSSVSVSEFIQCVFDDSKFRAKVKQWSDEDRRAMTQINVAMQSSAPLFHLLQEIALTNPHNEEMKIWAGPLNALKPTLEQIEIAATNTSNWQHRPTWLPGIADLATRDYSEFL